jgi:hypothetical protein
MWFILRLSAFSIPQRIKSRAGYFPFALKKLEKMTMTGAMPVR